MADEAVIDLEGKFNISELMQRSKARRDDGPAANGEAMPEPERPAAVRPVADDDADDLPGAADVYVAHSRAENKPQLMLGLVMGDSSMIEHAYSDLRWMGLLPGKKPGESPVLLLRFLGVSDVVIEGRHLGRVYRGLRRHRLGWLRELPPKRDFRDDQATVITRITVKEPEK